MSAKPAQSASAAAVASAGAPIEPGSEARAPLCFVIDGDGSIRHFLSLILHGAGVDTEEFADGHGLIAALEKRSPDLVFLDVPLESSEAIASVVALGVGG
jgi:CheY-like chemotaxis protein